MRNILKTLTFATAAFGLVGASSAQTATKIETPWKAELGVYFPKTDVSGADEKVGATFGIGYSFLRLRDMIDLDVELRGTSYTLDFNGGSAEVSISQLLFGATYRMPQNPLFFNASVGFGQGEIRVGNVTLNDDDTDFVWTAGVGYQFQPRLYGIARLHGGDNAGYRGFSVGVGYRF